MPHETPSLNQMGVLNPDQIVDYTLVSLSSDMDVLKIKYGRPAGSFLPKRRSYEFKRIQKTDTIDSKSAENKVRYEISPLLRKAIVELDALLSNQNSVAQTKQKLQKEISELTTDFTARLAEISKAISSME